VTGLAARPPQAVLFACSHNMIRSPMAAALLRLRWGKTIWVDSCGVRLSARTADPFAIEVMDELGADLKPHRAKTFADLDDVRGDACARGGEYAQRGVHDLGADAVAVRDGNGGGHSRNRYRRGSGSSHRPLPARPRE
jgi:hypothetical protein